MSTWLCLCRGLGLMAWRRHVWGCSEFLNPKPLTLYTLNLQALNPEHYTPTPSTVNPRFIEPSSCEALPHIKRVSAAASSRV